MERDLGSCFQNIRELTLKPTVEDQDHNQRKSYGPSKNEVDHNNLELTLKPPFEDTAYQSGEPYVNKLIEIYKSTEENSEEKSLRIKIPLNDFPQTLEESGDSKNPWDKILMIKKMSNQTLL